MYPAFVILLNFIGVAPLYCKTLLSFYCSGDGLWRYEPRRISGISTGSVSGCPGKKSYYCLVDSYGSLPDFYVSLPNYYGSLPNSYGSLPESYGSLPNYYGRLPESYWSKDDLKSRILDFTDSLLYKASAPCLC